LLPIALTPYVFNFTGWITAAIVSCMGFLFIMQAYSLYKSGSISDAKKLMFGSFLYLPVVQIALMIGHKFYYKFIMEEKLNLALLIKQKLQPLKKSIKTIVMGWSIKYCYVICRFNKCLCG